MAHEIKAAIIGLCGVVAGVVLTNHYPEWVGEPKEGVFSVDVNTISRYEINQQVRDQIQFVPGTITISHVKGPAVSDLSVRLSSDTEFQNIKEVRNDEKADPVLQGSDKVLLISTPILRKGSVVKFSFTTKKFAEIDRYVSVKSGVSNDDAQNVMQKKFYEEKWFMLWVLVPVAFSIVATAVLFAIVATMRNVNKITEFSAKSDTRAIAVVLSVCAMQWLPFGETLSVAVLASALIAIMRKNGG